MRVTMVIPTYWSRSKEIGWKEGDAIYDHPTPIDEDGTLQRTLESMKILDNKNFKLVLLLCPTNEEILPQALDKVKNIVIKSEIEKEIETYIFTPNELHEMQKLQKKKFNQDSLELVKIKGYSSVRNACLFSAHVLAADLCVLIDDDEVFENRKWIDMSKEHINKRMYGRTVYGIAGYYLNKKDEFYDDVTMKPWMTYWDRFGSKTKAFDKIIACEPRIKITPFAFGGAMAIHKNMFKIVPFDPNVTRGEDIDYLINAKMFGFDFFLDNKLSIKHLPPKKSHPIWKRFREDIYRFLYEKSKLDNQYEVSNMSYVTASHFSPYPGDFLEDDLEDKIFKANVMLALDYISQNDLEGCKETVENIYLSKYEAVPKYDTFTEYRKVQKSWEIVISFVSRNRRELRAIMEKGNLSSIEQKLFEQKRVRIKSEDIVRLLSEMEEFKNFTKEEFKLLEPFIKIRFYEKNQFIFKEGGKDSKLYIILRGCVRIIRYTEEREEILIANICTRGILGETAIVNDRYFVYAIADETVELLMVEQKDIENLIEEHPVLGNKLLRMLLEKLYFKLSNNNDLLQKTLNQNTQIND